MLICLPGGGSLLCSDCSSVGVNLEGSRLSAAPSVQGLGACLTQANLEDIKRFIEDFAVRSLLPAMEARVRALNHQVSVEIC